MIKNDQTDLALLEGWVNGDLLLGLIDSAKNQRQPAPAQARSIKETR